MIANTSLHAFSMPTRPAASGSSAALSTQAGADPAARTQTAATATGSQPPAAGARGALLDRWA